MRSLWLSFVPRHVAEDILLHPDVSPIGREQRFQAVALFADVSGFTAMSEALGKAGRSGTEELTTILNTYFGPMIDLIESCGGIIGKFGGDALTVLFPYTRRTQARAVRRAIQCALDMQANMHHYALIPTSAGPFSLAMKAGLAAGPVLCTTVGAPMIRLEYIIGGQVLDRCADAEHHAGKGEVVVDNALLRHAGTVEIVEERGAFSRVARLKRRAQQAPLQSLPGLRPEAVKTLACYLHPAIAGRVAAEQSGFINEHRKVTVLFARFDGFDYDADPNAGARLQHYLSAVIEIVHRYDGYLNKVDMGDKGSKYIVLFGAPVAHENDEERALRCALELSALRDTPARIGVNTGLVYAGQVGAEARQEYTVMGDPVNLAARLMQACRPGQILVSGFTQARVAQHFTWEHLEPITVKGKAGVVPVHVVRGSTGHASVRLQEPTYLLPMVGRELELRQASGAVDHVLAGRGQILGITAEAGMGKSRLNAEIVKLATQRGLTGYGGACQSFGTNISYLVWHDIWRGFFGIDPAAPLVDQVQQLETELAVIDMQLIGRLPLLQPVLHLPLPDNELTQSLEPQLRAELLRSLLLDCLRHRARATPLLLVLEDAHWIDPLSGDLLEFIGRNLGDLPVLLIGLYRPHEGEHGLLQRMSQFLHATEIRLTEFTSEEAGQLIALKLEQQWGTAGIAPRLVERITAKAQGNPFYIEEMINYIRDRGVDPRDTAALDALDLPDSLHTLIVSRIDQLAEDEKTTLKVASVIGRVFKAGWLWGSYPRLGAPEAVKGHLETLSRLDITPMDKPEPELEYIFKHITTQEVAYESLAFALRAALHEHIGQLVEQIYADNPGQQVDVLAYHYGRSRNTAKQRVYFRQAGDAAKANYANQAAIDYYQRLLPLLPETEQSDVMRKLGEVWQLTGKWPEAQEIYHRALALAQRAGDSRGRAWCQLSLGHLLSDTQAYREAFALLEEARTVFEQLGDESGVRRVLGHLSNYHNQQGDYLQALACSERQMQLATEQGDQIGISVAAYQMGMMYWNQGDLQSTLASLQRSLDVATECDYRRGAILAGGDMAGVYWLQGDSPRALGSLRHALESATEIGDLQASGFMIGNAGAIYQYYGDYLHALECYRRSLQIAAELGDWTSIVSVIGNIAVVFKEQERLREAERVNVRAVELGRMLNSPYHLCGALYNQADIYARQQRYAEAIPINQEAQVLAAETNDKDAQFMAQGLAIHLHVGRKEVDAQAAVGDFLALLHNWPDDDKQAAVHYEIWRIDRTQEDSRQRAAHLYRALYRQAPKIDYRERFVKLTGETLPDLPPLPPLPESIMGAPADLEALLKHVGVALEV